MYDIVFAKEKKIFTTQDVNEATAEAASNYQIEATPYTMRDISIGSDGTVNDKKITEYGWNCLMKLLGIPVRYAQQIPRDLLFTTIYRLQKDKAATEVFVLSRAKETEDEIASIVKAPYDEIDYAEVLGAFAEYKDVKEFTLSERLLIITLTFEELEVNGPEKEDALVDTLNVGTFVYNSILKATPLNMSSGLYRNECKNSYLMPILGKVRADYKTPDPTARLLRFTENIRCYDGALVERLQLRFKSIFSDKTLFDDEVVKYWKSLSRVVGTADADKLVNVDEESRKDLVSYVSQRNRRNKKARLLGQPIDDRLPTNVELYTFLNDVTQFAQKMTDISARIAIEKTGGTIIQDLVLN